MKKFSSLLVALMLVVGIFGAGSVNAQTQSVAELQALVNQLLAQIATLGGGAAAPAAPAAGAITSDLTIGSTGADVTTLQTFLVSKGFLTMPNGVAMGYFGTLTKNALAAFQAANGITPAAGYFGPKTRAVVNPMLAPVVTVPGTTVPGTPSTPTTDLEGDFGIIDSVTKLSQYNNEEVGEGQSDVRVAGFEVNASADGDIALQSMKVTFSYTGSASSRLNRYVDTVSIWKGSDKIATVDVDDFSKSGLDYSKVIPLKAGVIVKADATDKFYITIDAATTIDSLDLGTVWTVDVENIRFQDGSGAVTTDTVSFVPAPIEFSSFSSAANIELKLSLDSSNPEIGNVSVDDTSDTSDVVLLVGKLQAKGSSDLTINQMPILLTTGSSSQSISAIVNTLTLSIDDEEWSESVASSTGSGTVTFGADNDLGYTIPAGKTVSFTITADINDIQTGSSASGAFYEGDSITATLANADSIVAEDEEGDNIGVSEKTGAANGNAQTFRLNVVDLAFISGTVNAPVTDPNSGTSTSMTGTLKLSLTGKGGDLVEPVASDFTVKAATTTGGIAITVTNMGFTVTPNNSNNLIPEDTVATVTLTPTLTNSEVTYDGTYFFYISSVKWGLDGETQVTQENGLDNFQTSNAQFFDK